jgi:hypothetical protein
MARPADIHGWDTELFDQKQKSDLDRLQCCICVCVLKVSRAIDHEFHAFFEQSSLFFLQDAVELVPRLPDGQEDPDKVFKIFIFIFFCQSFLLEFLFIIIYCFAFQAYLPSLTVQGMRKCSG